MKLRDYMYICFAMLRCADEMLMLPGWQKCWGASGEYNYSYKMALRFYS
ncbi:DUF4406 domain-containing protein, partial [Enterobacter hormaechei]